MKIAEIFFLLFISTALSSSSRRGRKSGKRGSTALSSSSRRGRNSGKRGGRVYAVKSGGVAKLSKDSKDDEEKEVPMGPIYAQFFGFGGSSIAMVLPGIFLKLF